MKPSPKNNSPILSVIVLNYNALPYLEKLFESICQSVLTSKIEVILADNASADNSLNIIKDTNYYHPQINFRFLQNGKNIGFSAGNNRAVTISHPDSKYILFLNPDTTVEPNTLQGMIDYLNSHPQIDSATCYVNLTLTSQLQPECHRGFPTPWNTFCHFFLPFMSRLFPKFSLFNGYLLGHLDYTKVQQIDCCVGAFFMIRRHIGNEVGWWNEKYFMYGEDLDFCYKIKKAGHNLFFIPFYKINHYQGMSSGIKKSKSAASRETKIRSALATTNAMRIFYQENLMPNYHPILHPLISLGISLIEYYRLLRAKYL